ncbi:hypothetical protein Nepgr_024944 [Nepenthes gracilis]|uniref:Chloroplast lumen common family protein n=1 Tax=Nepenthes gracilis TaxID=150966 RepID=A0AAD3Y100_NEPGR|nr:hypothetical protein Nepgr_024944 [Nepenthes gracilis]
MESLANINHKSKPFHLFFNNRRGSFSRPLSSISFKTTFSSLSLPSLSVKMKSSSSETHALSASSKTPQNPDPFSPFSVLKAPVCIAVAAVALFFSRLPHKPSLALAEPISKTTTSESVPDEEREKDLEEFVSSHPDDVQALKSLMEAKIKNRKLPEAIEVVSRLIELEPDEDEWQLLKSHMYIYTGESESAKMGFEEILAKDPLRVEAFHGLVMAVSQSDSESNGLGEVMKRIEGAMEKCKREKMKDELRDFKLLIAQIRVIEGNYMEALKVYQELAKEEPRDFRPYLCQGIIYTLLGKKNDAEKQFEKYKRLVPKEHPYARYFDDNMLATKVFSQMAENQRMETGVKS